MRVFTIVGHDGSVKVQSVDTPERAARRGFYVNDVILHTLWDDGDVPPREDYSSRRAWEVWSLNDDLLGYMYED